MRIIGSLPHLRSRASEFEIEPHNSSAHLPFLEPQIRNRRDPTLRPKWSYGPKNFRHGEGVARRQQVGLEVASTGPLSPWEAIRLGHRVDSCLSECLGAVDRTVPRRRHGYDTFVLGSGEEFDLSTQDSRKIRQQPTVQNINRDF